jgi:hypothetical protein
MRAAVSRLLVPGLILAMQMGCSVDRPRLGAPEGSYTQAKLSVKVAEAVETIDGSAVTPKFFSAGPDAVYVGRAFVEPDYATGATGVAMLSHRYWVERFESSPAVIGSRIVVDGQTRTIVGVAAPNFQPDGAGLLWIPKRT